MARALITWEERFSLGLNEIDEQHQSLVDLISRIWLSIVENEDKASVFSLIDELEKNIRWRILRRKKPSCA